MKATKTVQQVLAPPAPHMVGDGFRVHNFFPSGYNIDSARMSPFFLLDYNSLTTFTPSEKPRGVDVHPHRGFETVTLAFKGKVEHYDSAGNHGIIGEGDVQWMTAASGILHKEFHEKEFSKTGGEFQMVQLWVNLPAKYKMSTPKYQGIEDKEFNRVVLPNGDGEVVVIAGNLANTKGKAETFTPIEMYRGELNAGANLTLSLPANFNTGILVINGSLLVNETDLVPQDHFALFQNDGTEISIQANEKTTFLLLSGEAINEPIVAHGPFLMNTEAEIRTAMKDFGSGKFGHLD